MRNFVQQKGRVHLSYEEFICRVQENVKEKLGNEVRVEHRRITRNNGVELQGLAVLEDGQKISPLIYLEDFYRDYREGRSLTEIVDGILRIYDRSRRTAGIDYEFYTKYENVEPRIVCKLVNYERNRKLLHKIPHIRCLDLALVFYYALEDEMLCGGTILIHNSHLDMWKVTLRRICETARRNTLRLFPYEFQGIQKLLEEEYQEPDLHSGDHEAFPMYVLSNKEKRFGAVNMLYDTILSAIGRELDDDFYVLPSSIHECIIIPAAAGTSAEELKSMVWEINRTQVQSEEVLSDQVYFYEREGHRLRM